MPPRARRTARLEGVVHYLGLAFGGRPAASFAKSLMVPVSNDTLLRLVRRRICVRTEPLVLLDVIAQPSASHRSCRTQDTTEADRFDAPLAAFRRGEGLSAEPPWYGPVCLVVWEGRGRETPLS